jgi:SAM-dependent methyltransferase
MIMLRLFDDKSDLYASARPSYPAPLYEFIVGQCFETKRAWDCACGNGQSAISLVDFFNYVDATDVSANQIKNAFNHPKVGYFVCPSEHTPFEENAFDLVCVAQALHWMDYDRFWPEVKRVLKPGGVFSAWGYCWTTIDTEIDAIIQKTFLDVIAPYWADQNRLLWNHYRDLNIPFRMIETSDFEMNMFWDLDQFLAYLYTWSATKRCVDAVGQGFLDEVYRQVLAVWGNPRERKNVRIDFFCIIGRNEI